ncbi:MAG: hypothetical protein L7F78_01995 [Syntrophales bacterium LBB04]|nr:hypothetical protein [Syntrophales bacterium LBB04]
MVKSLRYFVVGVLVIVSAVSIPAYLLADDELLEGTDISKQYLIQLSGTVLNETFSGAQALLTLMSPAPGQNNPYQLTIEGFPKRNSRNSFFWNSNYSEMSAISNYITCDIKRTFIKQVPLYFIFLSPELLRHTGSLELLGDEGKKYAEKTALPTLINATAGNLKLHIYSSTVSGTVWMKGYDPVEKSFVMYSANLYGKRSYKLTPKRELKKCPPA